MHRLRATYFDLQRFRGTLILNHKGDQPLPVEITAFSNNGVRRDLGVWELAPQSAERLNLGELLADAGSSFRQGSLEVRHGYEGCPLVVSAALVLEDQINGLAFDEQLGLAEERRSSRLEGVGWLPSRQGRATLWITNQGNTTLEATIEVEVEGREPRRSRRVRLKAHETDSIRLQEWERLGRFGGASGRIRVEWTGDPEAITAWGWLEESGRGFSAVVDMVDPEAQSGLSRWGGGLRVHDGDGRALVPVLVVGNLDGEANAVQVRMPWQAADGTEGVVELDPVELASGEVVNLTPDLWQGLEPLWPTVQTASVEVAGTGALTGSLWSVSADGSQVYRVPLVDPQTKASAGIYPWTLEDDTESWIYLTNTTAEIQEFNLWLGYEEGEYVLGTRKLGPGQTYALDVGELWASGEPDMNGNPLPPDVTKGQAHWSLIGAELHAMLGRVEYVDRAHALSSTMACSNCCPDSYWEISIIPGPDVWFPVNNWQEFSFWQRNQDCYGVIGPPFPIDPTEWYWTIVEGEAQPEVYDMGYRIEVIVFGTMRRVLLFTHHVVFWVCTPVGTFPVYSYPHTSVDVSAYEFSITASPTQLLPRPKEGGGQTSTITVQTDPEYANVMVHFETEMASVNSGGHNAAYHLEANPPATQAIRTARHGVLSSLQGYTDGNGRRQTTLETPHAAGAVNVCAASEEQCPRLPDSRRAATRAAPRFPFPPQHQLLEHHIQIQRQHHDRPPSRVLSKIPGRQRAAGQVLLHHFVHFFALPAPFMLPLDQSAPFPVQVGHQPEQLVLDPVHL